MIIIANLTMKDSIDSPITIHGTDSLFHQVIIPRMKHGPSLDIM